MRQPVADLPEPNATPTEQDTSPTGQLIASMLAAVSQMQVELTRVSGDGELPAGSPVAPTQALPGHSRGDPAHGSTRVADELAEMVCRMGGLDRSTIDREANFVDLGLDSLFLTRLASQIRKQLGVRVKLAEVLETTPTIESLAKRIEREITTGSVAATAITALDPRPTNQPSSGDPGEAILALSSASVAGHAAPPSNDIVALISEQLRVMNQQLDLLASHASAAEEPANER